MEKIFLKCVFDDGTVYFKLVTIADPEDEYIYEGLEVIYEPDNHWETDEYELTEEDLSEMYEDGFCDIDKREFDEVYAEAKKHLQK